MTDFFCFVFVIIYFIIVEHQPVFRHTRISAALGCYSEMIDPYFGAVYVEALVVNCYELYTHSLYLEPIP